MSMRRNNGRRVFDPAQEFSAFLPWLAAHIVIGVVLCAYIIADEYGREAAAAYYRPLVAAAFVSAAAALVSYAFVGRRDPYKNIELGEFDKMMIYGRFGKGKYSRAVNLLKEAVTELHLYNFNDALNMFKDIETEEQDSGRLAVVYFYTGRCYQLMGYPANGVIYYKKAIENGLDTNDTYLLAARCLTQNGRFDEAVEYYNILLERDCYFDFIYTDMGIAYLKKGDGEKALENFEKSLDEGKNYAFALGGCSLACLLLKDLEKSTEYYKKALTCNMEDLNGFKTFYCNIAEAAGMLDDIDPNIRRGGGSEELSGDIFEK